MSENKFDKKSVHMLMGPAIPFIMGTDDVGIVKKVKTIFMDVETEGEKRGYEKASAEYEPAYRKIEKEYDETKKALESAMAKKDTQVDKLVARLQELEKKEESLEKQIKNKTEKVSTQLNIPLSSVTESMMAGSILGVSLIDLIYSLKENKLRAAEEKGYVKAKAFYENKIKELKENLKKLKKKGDAEVQDVMNLINDVINEIIESETRIAELEIMLMARRCG